jgi:hypothetical protein
VCVLEESGWFKSEKIKKTLYPVMESPMESPMEWCEQLMGMGNPKNEKEKQVWVSMIILGFMQAMVMMMVEGTLYLSAAVLTAKMSSMLIKSYRKEDVSTSTKFFVVVLGLQVSFGLWLTMYCLRWIGRMGRKKIVENMQKYVMESTVVGMVSRSIVEEIRGGGVEEDEVPDEGTIRRLVAKVAVGMLFDRMTVIQGERFLRDMVRMRHGGNHVQHHQIHHHTIRMDMGG